MTRRNPAEYNFNTLEFDEQIMQKHFTKGRSGKKIGFVVLHHMVIRDLDVNRPDALDACFATWQKRESSAHYGVDGGFIRQFVYDSDTAWATGKVVGNQQGISIEHVNVTLDEPGTANDYLISELTLETSARLTAAIHKKHGLGRPTRATVKVHQDFKATACPGPYFMKVLDRYIALAQKFYDGGQPAKPATRFADVPKEHAFYEAIEWMAVNNITTGYGGNNFGVNVGVNRGMISAFFYRFMNRKGLSDVPSGHPWEAAIAWMVGTPVSNGFDDGTFRLEAPLTRADFAAMAYRLIDGKPIEPSSTGFKDVDRNTPHYEAISWLKSSGITEGVNGNFEPNRQLTRGEAAAFLFRMKDRRK